MNMDEMTENLKKNLRALHQYTATPGEGTTRLPFTKEARAAANHIRSMMEEVGLEVREDEAGNIIGLLKGADPSLPALVVGSHFDTVNNGGDFDGLAGVMTGIEIARMLKRETLKRNFIVLGFCDEEGMRFGTGYFGSKSILGQVTQEELRHYKDKDDVSVYEAMKGYGLVPENLPRAAWDLKTIKAFVEMHIEQGPVLYQSGDELGLVECIVGIQRYIVTVRGRSDHAGTTPMDMRIDAVEAATRVISRIPDWAREKGEGTVATTGYIKVLPGGMNIVAEEVQFSVDVRSRNKASIDDIVAKIRDGLDESCKRNGATYTMDNKLTITPVNLSRDMLSRLEKFCKNRGYSYRRMISGAGHDALAIGQVLETVMVFVPSRDGRSHCPVEWTEYGDISKAVAVIYDLIMEMQ
ncbi:MAG: M20 family metallo-hydrolase [Spirochaetaceae bacterium]|jgi:allantoate deiminase|nr:M20 family metallo-hydrolase [Spirochaetaceae bacterium]